tara:strand:+ start:1718 stop:2266 length:549 start_codon:yes stop_codon:yes gene_type:complete
MTEEQKPGRLEILVIDPDPDLGELLGEWIEETGADATTITDGLEGIREFNEKVKNKMPYDGVIIHDDVIFYDCLGGGLHIPAASTAEVYLAIKKSSPKTPVYILTRFPIDIPRLDKNRYMKLRAEIQELNHGQQSNPDEELKPENVIPWPFGCEKIFDISNQIRSQKYDTENPPTPQRTYQS